MSSQEAMQSKGRGESARAEQRGILSARSRAIEDRTQCGAILFCGMCCAVFIIEDRRFSNTVQKRLKESLLLQQQFYH